MAEALYRKYRPNTFAEVAEQGHVVRTVTNQLAQGSVAHAYLFAGPRGVGKTTIARLLAKALNCETRQAGQSEPCNTCWSCLETKQGRMMDIIEIDAASQTKVDETRENIIENVRTAPSRGKFKVFIIDEVHMFSTGSFNALLKTLEEPPAHVVFILATTELHKIPATIISRCQRFDFHRVPPKEMIERLETISKAEGVAVEPSVFVSIARLSEGCLRDAESLLGQLFALGEKTVTEKEASIILPATHTEIVVELVQAVTKKDAPEALRILDEFVEQGGSVRHLLDEILEYVRTMMFASLGFSSNEEYDPGTLKRLAETAKLGTASDHRRFLDLMLSARFRPSLSSIPQLPLEIAIVETCSSAPVAPIAVQSAPIPPAPLLPSLGRSPLQPTGEAPLAGRGNEPMPIASIPVSRPPIPEPASAFQTSDFDLPPSPIDSTKATPPVVGVDQTLSNPLSPSLTLPFTLADLQEKWGRCCAYVAERNMSLPMILNSSKPVAIDGDTLTISLSYMFHVKAMEEHKAIRLLQEAIGNVMQAMPKAIVCVLEKGKEETNPVDTLVEAFGGQVL
ncbi:MAG: DNA polymerase III subunit gamma/tau [Patescibacteria group bacterium]|jgi:DNA polymerase-3 subunit gamma/tau